MTAHRGDSLESPQGRPENQINFCFSEVIA
jgi:hypothetical protein